MNKATKKFLEELKRDENVQGVILFGSWARGNNRPDSDVDLIVILNNGYQRTAINKYDQNFEIVYTTVDAALDFWKNHLDDAANLWEVAEIIFDKDKKVESLGIEISEVLKNGKKEIGKESKAQLEFSAVDTINAVAEIAKTDITTAGLVLDKTVIALTEQYFDLKRLWIPAPKQRIFKIKELDAEYYSLLQKYYEDGIAFKNKIELSRLMTKLVFN